MELFGSKIKALLDRAARDLYDISNMIRFGLFDESAREILKKCALFYMAVGNDRVSQHVDVTRIDDITFHKIHTDLLPVKRKSDDFDLLKTRELVKTYLEDLMQLTDREKQFMVCFGQKEYLPELLFDDEEVIGRLKKHPMALWKMSN